MRRFQALLIAAGLAAMPALASADSANSARSPGDFTFERHEWFSSGKGRLGVMVMGLTPELRKHLGAAEDRGVLVARVEQGSAAEAAGLAVGDVIVQVRGNTVDSATDVISALASVSKGQQADVAVVRDRQPLTVQVTMTEDPVKSNAMRWNPDDFFQNSDAWFRDMLPPGFEPFGQRRQRTPRWLPDLLKPWRQQPAPITNGSTSA